MSTNERPLALRLRFCLATPRPTGTTCLKVRLALLERVFLCRCLCRRPATAATPPACVAGRTVRLGALRRACGLADEDCAAREHWMTVQADPSQQTRAPE